MKVRICTGTRCTFYGANSIIDSVTELQEHLHEFPGISPEARLEVEVTRCEDFCKSTEKGVAPIVFIDDVMIERATSPQVMDMILSGLMEEKE